MTSGRLIYLFCLLLFIAASCSSPSRPRPYRDSRPSGEAATPETEEAAEKWGTAPPTPPDAPAVAKRALVLRVVGDIANFPRPKSPQTAEGFETRRERMKRWLQREELWSSASENERIFLSTPVVAKPVRESIDAKGTNEELLVMLWALGKVPRFPRYDSPAVSIVRLSIALPEIGEPTEDFVERAKAPSPRDIERAHEEAYMWAWRASVREKFITRDFPKGRNLDEMAAELKKNARQENYPLGPIRDGESFLRELIRFSAHFAKARGLLQVTTNEDFPALGKSYAELSESEFQSLRRMAVHRLHALNWLMGFSKSWDSSRSLNKALDPESP